MTELALAVAAGAFLVLVTHAYQEPGQLPVSTGRAVSLWLAEVKEQTWDRLTGYHAPDADWPVTRARATARAVRRQEAFAREREARLECYAEKWPTAPVRRARPIPVERRA